jgi:hypothetical protein
MTLQAEHSISRDKGILLYIFPLESESNFYFRRARARSGGKKEEDFVQITT